MEDKKDEIIHKMMNVDFAPNENIMDFQEDKKVMKFSLAEVCALGVAFASMPVVARTITTTTMQATGGLYRCRFPAGVSGQLAQKGGESLGAIINKGSGIVGQARWTPVNEAATTSTAVMPFNPIMLFMAAALMSIEKKLDKIQKTQLEILNYMKAKDKAEMQGDLNCLSEILNNYKHYWDNEKYKTTRHSEVFTIRREAEQKTVFYKNEIKKEISSLEKKSLISDRSDAKRRINKIKEIFTDYQTGLYLYGFATYLDVLLLEDFKEENLESAVTTIEAHTNEYRELYTKSYDLLKLKLDSSLQKNLIYGVANAVGNIGTAIGQIPFIKDGKVDKLLVRRGDVLKSDDNNNDKKAMSALEYINTPYAHQFIESINTVNALYNEPLEVYIDNENVYYIPESANRKLCCFIG